MSAEDVANVAQHALAEVPPEYRQTAMEFALEVTMAAIHKRFGAPSTSSPKKLVQLPAVSDFVKHASTTGKFCSVRTRGLVTSV